MVCEHIADKWLVREDESDDSILDIIKQINKATSLISSEISSVRNFNIGKMERCVRIENIKERYVQLTNVS